MDLTKFYQNKRRLEYNPRLSQNIKRTGFKKLISYDDRFDEVNATLINLLGKIKKNHLKFLDLGIGDAVYEARLPREILSKLDIYGVDISEKQLNKAKPYIKQGSVVNLDNSKLPFKDNYFDIILVSELLEHLFYPDRVINEAIRVLKNKGFLVLTFPNSGSLQLRIALLINGNSPLLNYPKNKEHIRYFDQKDILTMINKRLKLKKVLGLDSFLFGRWNFPIRIITPRFLEVIGNKYLINWALGNLMLFQK